MQIDEPASIKATAPLWRLAFRAGFLAAAGFAVVGMLRWLYWLYEPGSWGFPPSPQWWHAHEMIFGFALPVVAGFLLSAVATWTGLPGTRGRPLQLLFGSWLLARILLWLQPGDGGTGYLWLAWGAELLFICLLAYELGKRVLARRQWRNVVFLPVLAVLALFNTLAYLNIDEPLIATSLAYGAVWMITLLVVIIGGRVMPLFTGNRLGLKISPLPPWFEYTAWGSTALVGILSATGLPAALEPAFRVLCLLSCLVHSYRLFHWQGWKSWRVPLLWSMHLSYLCIPLSLALLALVGGDPVAGKNIMHLLGVGTIGGMILAMMARVSLGHTGRPLEPPRFIPLAFACVFLAALCRALLPMLAPELTLPAWKVSALLWVTAFGIFLVSYLPILTTPRADGKDG